MSVQQACVTVLRMWTPLTAGSPDGQEILKWT